METNRGRYVMSESDQGYIEGNLCIHAHLCIKDIYVFMQICNVSHLSCNLYIIVISCNS